jgi:hypothetical protein
MVGKTRFARQGKTGKAGVRGKPLLPCPERQGSGGIQPAHGWSRFQGRDAFGQGSIRAERTLCRGGLPRGGSPCRSVRAEAVKAWSRRRLWSLLRGDVAKQCITAPFRVFAFCFCLTGRGGAAKPRRSDYGRTGQIFLPVSKRRKLALTASLRGTEPLISDILF